MLVVLYGCRPDLMTPSHDMSSKGRRKVVTADGMAEVSVQGTVVSLRDPLGTPLQRSLPY